MICKRLIAKIVNITPKIFAKHVSIRADSSVLQGTSIAALVDRALCYNPSSNELDIYFSIAHELRHLWQLENNKSLYFNNYKSTRELSINDYNNQPAELDANAFGYLVMKVMFGVEAQFNGLDKLTKHKILERAEILTIEFGLTK